LKIGQKPALHGLVDLCVGDARAARRKKKLRTDENALIRACFQTCALYMG